MYKRIAMLLTCAAVLCVSMCGCGGGGGLSGATFGEKKPQDLETYPEFLQELLAGAEENVVFAVCSDMDFDTLLEDMEYDEVFDGDYDDNTLLIVPMCECSLRIYSGECVSLDWYKDETIADYDSLEAGVPVLLHTSRDVEHVRVLMVVENETLGPVYVMVNNAPARAQIQYITSGGARYTIHDGPAPSQSSSSSSGGSSSGGSSSGSSSSGGSSSGSSSSGGSSGSSTPSAVGEYYSQYAYLNLGSSGGFQMQVNIGEGYANYSGAWSQSGSRITCHIYECDSYGFLGDDYEVVSFTLSSGGATYTGSQIGLLTTGSWFDY